eukprot:TRINITY_DN1340_c0_g1_i1.p1 TRINITY_DN1340_c0_g1~~TRINITY_DN1340_c0_g1_i1.p1  ORF type:complete len:219 (+),score=46.62 TRINITY_DN1340_c0_g1_i1:108-764(+)
MPKGHLSFGLVAIGTNVLVQTEDAANQTTVKMVPRLLEKIPRHDTRNSYQSEGACFHYSVENEIIYLCIGDQDLQRRIAFAFLEDVKEKFCKKYSEPGKKYPNKDKLTNCADFKGTLSGLLHTYNTNPDVDKINKVKDQIEEVKGVMMENIDAIIGRGEKIDQIVDKTQQLNDSAVVFKKSATKLKTQMKWRNIKLIIIGVVIVVIIILIIVLIVALP